MSDHRVEDDFWYLYEIKYDPSLRALRYRIKAWFYKRKVRRQTKQEEERLRRAREDRGKYMAAFHVDGLNDKETQDLLAWLQPRYIRDDLPNCRQLPDLPLPKE